MKTVLVVTVPFADYAKGDHITDADAMVEALENHDGHVVQTQHPGEEFYAAGAEAEQPAPEPPAPARKAAKPAASETK